MFHVNVYIHKNKLSDVQRTGCITFVKFITNYIQSDHNQSGNASVVFVFFRLPGCFVGISNDVYVGLWWLVCHSFVTRSVLNISGSCIRRLTKIRHTGAAYGNTNLLSTVIVKKL